jgi:hypothetical protein
VSRLRAFDGPRSADVHQNAKQVALTATAGDTSSACHHVAMTKAHSAPCDIAIYTAAGQINTTTEQLLPENSRKDMRDPEIVLAYLAGRLERHNHIAFMNGSSAEAVFAPGIFRIIVSSDTSADGTQARR